MKIEIETETLAQVDEALALVPTLSCWIT